MRNVSTEEGCILDFIVCKIRIVIVLASYNSAKFKLINTHKVLY